MGKLSGATLSPAFNRDYKSRKEIVAALNEPKDFMAHHFSGQSGYCSITDIADGTVNVRFKKMASVCVIKVKDGVAS